MSKIKLNLAKLGIEDKTTLGNNIVSSMTANSAIFTTPNPTLAAYGTLITNLTAKNAAVILLRSQLASAMNDRDAAETAFDVGSTQLGSYVENVANGNPVIMGKAGMDLRSSKTPSAVPGTVSNVSVTASDNAGELDAQWDPVSGAKTYEVHTSPDGIAWTSAATATKSKAELIGMTSGQRMHARVRAIGAGGTGAWSDVTTKIVP